MPQHQDLTGQKSGTLIAKQYLGHSKWLCECSVCGNIVELSTDVFHRNIRLHHNGCKHFKEIQIGDVFGHLTVLEQAEDYIKPKSGTHERQWRCQCDCGRLTVVNEYNLKGHKSLSCGLCGQSVSIPEKAIFYYMSQIFDDIEENYKPDYLDGKEIDVYIPSLKVGIEYDGQQWHKDVDADIQKNNICRGNGVYLIRVREPKCPESDQLDKVIITPKTTTNGTHMTEPIKELICFLKEKYHVKADIDVDCLRDNADICKTIMSSMELNSLSAKCPDVATEWDYEKNAPLTPDLVPHRSGKKAWWICKNGHSYSSVIASRTGDEKCGCPYCAGKKLLSGFNDLKTIRPDVAAEFDEQKNGISASEILWCSNKKMWFKCSRCGHEWQSKVSNRTSTNNQGCMICGREKTRLASCKPVMCVETGKIFESATAASKEMSCGHSHISACCRGNQKTAGGYHWKYVEKK